MMKSNKKITKALIPVRAGSERVRNKNIREFCGSTLLEIKIRQMQRIPELDGVVVNSDSDEMLDIARMCGAQCVKREEKYALSSTLANDFYENAAANFDADVMVFANCTNPCISDETISKAIRMFSSAEFSMAGYDSLNTAHFVKDFLWLDGVAMNYNPDRQPRSQDLPDVLALNFAVNIIPTIHMRDIRAVVGRKPCLFPISEVESIDIDTELDFEFARFVYERCHRG